jgi:hypothetical protein
MDEKRMLLIRRADQYDKWLHCSVEERPTSILAIRPSAWLRMQRRSRAKKPCLEHFLACRTATERAADRSEPRAIDGTAVFRTFFVLFSYFFRTFFVLFSYFFRTFSAPKRKRAPTLLEALVFIMFFGGRCRV